MILANDENQGQDIFADVHVLPAVLLGASKAKAVIMYGNRAPVMAAFSSRGPNLVDPNILKPDVTALGVNILAAWPDWSPAAIMSALMTTAYVKDSKNNLISDAAALNDSESATPFEYGSGHVDPERAFDLGLIYDISTQDYLEYLCSLNYNSSQVTLFAGKNTTCPVASHFRPGDLNYPSFSVIFSRKLTGTTYSRTVTNVGIALSTYSVKVIEPEGGSITVQPKVLKFGKMGKKKEL
ncbi:subtilisin-like protease [Phtheirospermum japonicum]|uniref:Subtilisin-like protease n=1 Tax=Phtheirospermum japonicum TaxID=374723 RepID=A0A830BP24_9LAMI|nr:subtilisin-like protease [Phtheirospermum japonicum]